MKYVPRLSDSSDYQTGTHSISPLRGADRQKRYSSNNILWMVLWFVSYATSPVIVIVYDVSFLLSMSYKFQRRSGKNRQRGSMGNKTEKSSIAI